MAARWLVPIALIFAASLPAATVTVALLVRDPGLAGFESVPLRRHFLPEAPDLVHRGFWVIEDEDRWEELWAELSEPPRQVRLPSGVQLERRTLIVVASGMRPSQGYNILVAAVNTMGPILVVAVTEVQIREPCFVPLVVTFPHDIVSIPKTKAPVLFDYHLREYGCGEIVYSTLTSRSPSQVNFLRFLFLWIPRWSRYPTSSGSPTVAST